MERHREVPFWLCVGDVADADGRLRAVSRLRSTSSKATTRTSTCIASGELPPNLLYLLPNGKRETDHGVAGCGPRRYACADDVRACQRLSCRIPRRAPRRRPRPPTGGVISCATKSRRARRSRTWTFSCRTRRRGRFGCIEASMPARPRSTRCWPRCGRGLHLFGHHHRFTAGVAQGVPSLCLDPVGVSYLLIDRNTLKYQQCNVVD